MLNASKHRDRDQSVWSLSTAVGGKAFLQGSLEAKLELFQKVRLGDHIISKEHFCPLPL